MPTIRQSAAEIRTVPWSAAPIVTRGDHLGLPVILWGWADRTVLDTRRGLRSRGLSPAADPVALLGFQHRTVPGRRCEYASLFLVATARPRRTPSPAQLTAVAKALEARRTCSQCRAVKPYYLSTISRLCRSCEDATGFWRCYALDRGYTYPEVAA